MYGQLIKKVVHFVPMLIEFSEVYKTACE